MNQIIANVEKDKNLKYYLVLIVLIVLISIIKVSIHENNSINYLPEKIFYPLFTSRLNRNKLTVLLDSLNCNHCKNSWLISNKLTLLLNNSIYLFNDKCVDYNKFWSLTEENFKNCTLDDRYVLRIN